MCATFVADITHRVGMYRTFPTFLIAYVVISIVSAENRAMLISFYASLLGTNGSLSHNSTIIHILYHIDSRNDETIRFEGYTNIFSHALFCVCVLASLVV